MNINEFERWINRMESYGTISGATAENVLQFVNELLLNELFNLTKIEQVRKLDQNESTRYLELIEYLHENNIEIDFAIQY